LSDSDERLRARCRAGDERAWSELVRRHLPPVYALALRFTGRPESAEDVAQEVFLKLHRSLGAYDPAAGSFGAWLMTMARHCSIDHYRRTREARLREAPLLFETPAAGEGTDAALKRREARELVLAGLAALPVELREPIELCDLRGASYEDAAAALDVPLGTLKSRLSRARLEMARRLRSRRG
jgi:RNA polymerase sigma factor (sigma-70 family)